MAAVSGTKPTHPCDVCKTPTSSVCGSCKLIYQCSKPCQKTAWKAHHKYVCFKEGSKEEEYLSYRPLTPGLSGIHCAGLFHKLHHLPASMKKYLNAALTAHNGSPLDLAKLTAPVPKQGPIPFEIDGIPSTQEEYFKLTGTYYSEDIVVTPEDLLAIHANPFKDQPDPWDLFPEKKKEDAERVARFKKHPPLLKAAREAGIPGYGLQAQEDINPAEIACNFGGQLSSTPGKGFKAAHNNINAEAATFDLDQTRYTGKGIFTNDGPPNCMLVGIVNDEGVPYKHVLMTLRPIKKGEFLHWAYGAKHPLKQGFHHIGEKDFEEASAFCKEKMGNAQQYLSICAKLKKKVITVEDLYNLHMFYYIFADFQLFSKLHLKGILNCNETYKFLQKPEMNEFFGNREPIFLEGYIYIVAAIEKIRRNKELLEQLLKESPTFTQGSFFQVILKMGEDGKLSLESLPSYLKFAKLYDAILGFVNEHYIYGEESKEERLDQEALVLLYKDLLHKPKRVIDGHFLPLIGVLEERGDQDKIRQMRELEKRFKDSKSSS